MSREGRVADLGSLVHDAEIGFLTSLLIDLKLREMGRTPHAPITMERLTEASKHVGKLLQCRKRGLYK